MLPYNDEAGDWQDLDSPRQVPRYVAIADILRSFSADSDVLDVGCGEAVLRNYLPKNCNYTGVEQSAKAVRLALERNISTKIIHTGAESFDAHGERFDIIVFNEMLYYVADPVGLLQKYAALLRQGGVILCSIFQKPGSVPLKCRLQHWLDRRRPLSNVHCTKMVRAFMDLEAWRILHDCSVTIPDTNSQWHIWLAMPHPCNSRKSK